MFEVLKLVLFFMVFILTFSCERHEKIVCERVNNSDNVCFSQGDTNVFFFIENGNVTEITNRNENKMQHWSIAPEENKVKWFRLEKQVPLSFIRVEYNESNEIELLTALNDEIGETIYRKRNKTILNYDVCYSLGNLEKSVITYNLRVNKDGDTLPDHTYYRLNRDKSVSIVSDYEYFLKNDLERDSMVIRYLEKNYQNISYDNPKEHSYYPLLGVGNVNYLKNTLTFGPISSSKAVGTLWSFYDKSSKRRPYAYQSIIVNGDLLARIKDFSIKAQELEKAYPLGKIMEVEPLKKLMLENGVFVLEKGKLIRSNELNKAIDEFYKASRKTNKLKDKLALDGHTLNSL